MGVLKFNSPRRIQKNQVQRRGTDMKHTREQQPLPKQLRKRLVGKTSRLILKKVTFWNHAGDGCGGGASLYQKAGPGRNPEGTPDREAQARTKAQASDLMPRTLPTEIQDPISKVEMSAATIATLRAVMREEISTGMSALESRLTNKMDEQYIQMKKDLEEERVTRAR